MPLFGGIAVEKDQGDAATATIRSCSGFYRPPSPPDALGRRLGWDRSSGGGGLQTRHAYEVVGGHRGEEVCRNPANPSESGLRLPGRGLHPAEDLLDPLSFALADLVALGAGRAPIEPRRLASFDPGTVPARVSSGFQASMGQPPEHPTPIVVTGAQTQAVWVEARPGVYSLMWEWD